MSRIHGTFAALFSKQKKAYPGVFGKIDFLRYGIFIVISAWIFQGLLYMSKTEACIKLILDILLFFLFWQLGIPWYLAIFFAHSLNLLLNGQFFAMLSHMGGWGVSSKDFLRETERMAVFLENCKSVQCALAFGSLARGEYKATSDIDLRIIPRHGFFPLIVCSLIAIRMRIVAFMKGFPLDLYVFSLPQLALKMRTDEPPIVLAGNDVGLTGIYPSVIPFSDFQQIFRARQHL